MISFLYSKGSVVLFDECPLAPDTHIIMKIAAKTQSTMIGMGAKLYDEYLRLQIPFSKYIHIIFLHSTPLIWSTTFRHIVRPFQNTHSLLDRFAIEERVLRLYQHLYCARRMFLSCSFATKYNTKFFYRLSSRRFLEELTLLDALSVVSSHCQSRQESVSVCSWEWILSHSITWVRAKWNV